MVLLDANDALCIRFAHNILYADMQPLNGDFTIGLWRISPRRNLISNAEDQRPVEPKVMQVLLCLAERNGESVTREELIQAVWSGGHASDEVVTRTISRLREALDDDYRHPLYIETVRKIGYRLIPPVEPLAPSELRQPAHRQAYPPAAHRHRSLAWTWSIGVLLLLNLLVGYVLYFQTYSSSSLSSASIRTYPLTSLPGSESDPALSPNGEAVAFIWHGGPNDNYYNLYTQSLDGHGLKQRTFSSDRDHHPTWSPDGQHVAFLRFSETDCHILTIPVLGDEARLLSPCPTFYTRDLTWSPDGKHLAFASRFAPGTPYQVMLLDISTLTLTQLTTPTDFFGDIQPTFSPDGKWIAFQRSTDGAFVGDVFRVSLDGGPEIRLTYNNRQLFGLDWTRDSEAIMYASYGSDDTFGLWQVSVHGEISPMRVDVSLDAGHPSFALHRNRIAFTVQSYDTNIWGLPLANHESSTPIRLVQSTRLDAHPHISASDNQVAFATRRAGKTEIWTRPLTGGTANRLVSMPKGLAHLPQWSPDGQHLVIEVREGDTADLYVTDAQGSFPKRLTHDPRLEVSPTWSRDGQWVYFGSNRTGTWQIWRIASTGGSATQVTTGGGIRAQESVDGSILYFAKPGTPGIWQRPLSEGAETLALALPPPADWGNWIVTDEGIYFPYYQDPARPTLSFFAFATKHIQPLYTPERPLLCSFPGMALSPDNQILLFTQVDRYDRDLMWAEIKP